MVAAIWVLTENVDLFFYGFLSLFAVYHPSLWQTPQLITVLHTGIM